MIWTCSDVDHDLLHHVVDRAVKAGMNFEDRLSLWMDLMAAHCNGMPLRLVALLAADDFNFAHDVLGIQQHIDRSNGKLLNCFVPRFAVSQELDGKAVRAVSP